MRELTTALEEIVRRTRWTADRQRIGSAGIRLAYQNRRFGDNSRWTLGRFKPQTPEQQVVELATQLRRLFERFLNRDSDRIGNGLFTLMGGLSTMREPTINLFATTLITPATLLGPERVTELLVSWEQGETLRYRENALLEGVKIENQELVLEEGVHIMRLPTSSSDLPASLPDHGEVSVNNYLGGIVLSVDCEMLPAIYAGTNKQTRPISDVPVAEFTAASGGIPNLGFDTFCESLSLARDHHIRWQSTWRDYGELQAFSNMAGSPGMYRSSFGGSTAALSQEHLEMAKKIHLIRHAGRRANRGVDLAIDRWMESIQPNSYTNRLIQLRIAFEALYLKDGVGEKSFRLATYGAWHLGSNIEERRRHFRILRTLYGLASTAVHAGKVKNTKENLKTLSDAQDICRAGILQRLEEENEPQWDDLMLGSNQS